MQSYKCLHLWLIFRFLLDSSHLVTFFISREIINWSGKQSCFDYLRSEHQMSKAFKTICVTSEQGRLNQLSLWVDTEIAQCQNAAFPNMDNQGTCSVAQASLSTLFFLTCETSLWVTFKKGFQVSFCKDQKYLGEVSLFPTSPNT